MVIYKITHKLSGKSYIGQTNNLKKRWKQHCKGTQVSAVSLAIKVYGVDAFYISVIGSYQDEQDCNNAEDYFIEYFNTLSPNGYNLVSGQQKARSWSTESRLKASRSKLGEKNPRYRCADPATACKISKALTGRVFSKEHREHIRQSRLGTKASPEARINMSMAAKRSVNSGRFKKRLSNG